MIIIILFSLFIVFTQTNLLNKLSGSQFTMNVNYDSVIDGADSGYLRLVRNDDTPLTYEWSSFDNGLKYKYFSINEGESKSERITIRLPEMTESELYYLNVEITYNSGETIVKQLDFLVI